MFYLKINISLSSIIRFSRSEMARESRAWFYSTVSLLNSTGVFWKWTCQLIGVLLWDSKAKAEAFSVKLYVQDYFSVTAESCKTRLLGPQLSFQLSCV